MTIFASTHSPTKRENTMEELLKKIEAVCEAFHADAQKAVEGNKAAAARSRKASLEMEKLQKEWRKVSLGK